MRSQRHSSPKVNAGSMADIAFLLLIFFLVTTTISVDAGINRKLPLLSPPNMDCSETINDRNIFRILLGQNDQIFVGDRLVELEELKELIKSFIDNNCDGTCNYCSGEELSTLSDHPKKAVVSLQTDKRTTYDFYIKVQDELTKVYLELREGYALKIYGKKAEALTREELEKVRAAYPFILSEAETK
ncbi:biopolymer transport protein ExbD [Flavobacteriaceae bacterium MAR_2010_105]|nr:biopolymer transport protein ExbD [Flavobacteriaceae bacterium MAR_2010_105]